MGNTGSNGAGRSHPSQYPNAAPPYYHQYPGYYPPPPPQVPGGTYGQLYGNWVGGHYPYGGVQTSVTIRNDININKETLRIEPDEDDPGKFLAAFTFDATAPGSITVVFFAKETDDCNLIATKESVCKPVTISFEQGIGQKFRQPSGTGVDSSLFEDWMKDGEIEVYPLVVKAEACPSTSSNKSEITPGRKCQVTQAVIEKERGEFKARVVKQILWVNGTRYELQDILGIGNAVESEVDANDSAKECVICLSVPRDTIVLPCRHMCMCSGCAVVLRFQTNRCPICRQPFERLLEIMTVGEKDLSNPHREKPHQLANQLVYVAFILVGVSIMTAIVSKGKLNNQHC